MRSRHLSLAHEQKIYTLQQEIKRKGQQASSLSLVFDKVHSNTTRSKSYKNGCVSISCDTLNEVVAFDVEKKCIRVEPRVTMEALANATLPYGLLPPIIPEFKSITVGGAIMGSAAESTSHKWGIFHDSCTRLHLINGNGELLIASPYENADVFYGLSGSYGSFGLLVSADIQLIPVKNAVKLSYSYFNDAQLALKKMQEMVGKQDFLDGILFSKDHAVIITGSFMEARDFSKPKAAWFAKKVKENTAETILPLYDYLFRYDQGAFWMGSFLFSFAFLARYFGQGFLKMWRHQGWFTQEEIEKFKSLTFPGDLVTRVTRPWMKSQRLWGLLHKAEKWVQDRLVIQDCCIPSPNAAAFLDHILMDPGIFPIWLCPIKGTHTSQFLAPHYGHPLFINFGIYGCPSISAPMQQITQQLENITYHMSGRKVLYSRSYYDEDSFWKIYSKRCYESLRKKTHANGIWRGIIEKVLSE